jgi:DNA-binding XRE family transcriptional regulator
MNQYNNVKKLREARMISKAELARLAEISPLTLDRIERGMACRMATKRKITLALGLPITDKSKVFKQ